MKKIISVFIAVCFFAVPVMAADTYPVHHLGLRPLGMGGAFTAVADDYNAFFYNPAPLVYGRGGFNIFQLAANTNHDTVDFAKWFIDNNSRLTGGDLSTWQKSDLDHISNAKIKINAELHAVSFLIPNLFGLCAFGTGVFGNILTNVSLDSGVLIPSAKFDVFLDVMVPISIAKEIAEIGNGKLAAGATVKIINRRALNENRNALELTALNPTDLLAKAQQSTFGYGLDLGFSYTLPGMSSIVAFAIQDLYTAIGSDKVKSSWDLGYAFKPDWNFAVFSNFIFALDIDSVNDSDITFFNKLHVGMETKFIGLIALRGGLYQGYPGFGVGLDLGIFKFDFADYGVELGRFPGQLEERNYAFSLTFGLGF